MQRSWTDMEAYQRRQLRADLIREHFYWLHSKEKQFSWLQTSTAPALEITTKSQPHHINELSAALEMAVNELMYLGTRVFIIKE